MVFTVQSKIIDQDQELTQVFSQVLNFTPDNSSDDLECHKIALMLYFLLIKCKFESDVCQTDPVLTKEDSQYSNLSIKVDRSKIMTTLNISSFLQIDITMSFFDSDSDK